MHTVDFVVFFGPPPHPRGCGGTRVCGKGRGIDGSPSFLSPSRKPHTSQLHTYLHRHLLMTPAGEDEGEAMHAEEGDWVLGRITLRPPLERIPFGEIVRRFISSPLTADPPSESHQTSTIFSFFSFSSLFYSIPSFFILSLHA